MKKIEVSFPEGLKKNTRNVAAKFLSGSVLIINFIKNFWAKLAAIYHQFSLTKGYRIIGRSLVIIVIIVAVLQVIFGVLIYGFKDKSVGDKNWLAKAADSRVTEFVAKNIPYPVAVVNYDIITYRDFLSEKTYIHHFYNATNQSDIDYREIDRQVFDQLIENRLVSQQASRYGVRVEKSDLDSTINSIIDQNGGTDKVEKILQDLYGLNLKDFRKLVRTQLLRDKINQKVIAKVQVSHILIRVDSDAADDKVNEAKVKIDGILKEINDGLDFAEAAKKYSEDVGSAESGGKLEPFARGEMVDEFSDVAFSTEVGKISEPVRTEFGWHIIKVESKTGKIQQKFYDWILELKDKSLLLKLYEV